MSDLLTTVAIIIDSYDRHVPIYFSVSKDVSHEVITENEWVWQMLLNFLTNACKHTDEGDIHVNVSVCSATPPGRKEGTLAKPLSPNGHSMPNGHILSSCSKQQPLLLFRIVDSGVGVPLAKQGALFEAFSQAQRGQSTGTGLGLFSVYSRCQKLGGACGMISPNTYPVGNGTGSTFWFTVPYIPSSSRCVQPADFIRYAPSHARCDSCEENGIVVMGIGTDKNLVYDGDSDYQSSPPCHLAKPREAPDLSYTAFVVDDVMAIRKLLKRSLLGLGFTRVELFENGKRALDAMQKEVVDVVFMDIQVCSGQCAY